MYKSRYNDKYAKTGKIADWKTIKKNCKGY